MPTPAEIQEPDLRKSWVTAKKLAETKAKAKKQDKTYKALEQQFELKLGPSLKKWPELYPNLGQMRSMKERIDVIIDKYGKFVKAAKPNLDKSVWSPLSDELTSLTEQLETRMALASSLLESDEDLALKQAIKESKEKKPLKPVVVFQHPDLSAQIMAMAPKAQDIVTINQLEIVAILADDKILNQVDDNDGNMGQKIRDAADFGQLKKDIAVAYVTAAKAVKADDNAFNKANADFELAVDKAIRAAVGRASDEMHRLVGIRIEYRNYRIKSGVKLGLTVAGTVAGGVSLALAPFTGPAMAVSALGVIKGAVSIGEQIADLSMQAEEKLAELKADVSNLQNRYKGWPGFDIGSAEVGMTLVNAIAPTFFTTIKRCASSSGTVGSKINGLETKAGDMSIKLNEAITAQTDAKREISAWYKNNKNHLDKKLEAEIAKLLKALKENEKEVGELLTNTQKMNDRVKAARKDHAIWDKAIQELAAREPTAAKFAEVFIQIGASVGFLVSANVGWPDAYNIAESAKAVVDGIGNGVATSDAAWSAAESLRDEVKEAMKV